MSKLFINAKVILPDRIIDGAVRIDGEKITDVYENGYTKNECDEVIDVGGLYLSPGFIDVHVHGGDGGYFMSVIQEQFAAIAGIEGIDAAMKEQFATTAEILKSLSPRNLVLQIFGTNLLFSPIITFLIAVFVKNKRK